MIIPEKHDEYSSRLDSWTQWYSSCLPQHSNTGVSTHALTWDDMTNAVHELMYLLVTFVVYPTPDPGVMK